MAHAAIVPRVLEASGRTVQTGYLEGVATAVTRQGEGLGSLAVAEATRRVRSGFDMGALGTGRHRFYARLGWERWRGPSFARHGAELVRTPEDDDALMVLRFGPSADLDVTGSLTCEGRPGDDW